MSNSAGPTAIAEARRVTFFSDVPEHEAITDIFLSLQ